MNEFKQAKNVIRAALTTAARETVESILEAARGGRVPFSGADGTDDFKVPICGCLAQRIANTRWYHIAHRHLSVAYHTLAYPDDRRQRLLVAICRADLRRRDRAAVRALIESAHEQCEVGA